MRARITIDVDLPQWGGSARMTYRDQMELLAYLQGNPNNLAAEMACGRIKVVTVHDIKEPS